MKLIVELSEEEKIVKHYLAALDSVNLMNGVKPSDTSDADWADTISRNREHLVGMIAKDYWTIEDLTPLRNAIALYPEETL